MSQPPDNTLFTELEADRDKRFLLQLSLAEREFLRNEAKKKQVRVTTLVRECLRKGLLEHPQTIIAPKEQ